MTKELKRLDPRVVRTRQMLRDALVSLIAEKGFDALTVQDIADRATLNRATFYLHYQDKHELLINSLRDAIDNKCARSSSVSCEPRMQCHISRVAAVTMR